MSKNNFRDSNEIIMILVRVEDFISTFSFDDKEYAFPNILIPKEAKIGEKLVFCCKLLSSYQEQKEKTAKDILNEILNN